MKKPMHHYNLTAFRARHGLDQLAACKALGCGIQSWRKYEHKGLVPLAWLHMCAGYEAYVAAEGIPPELKKDGSYEFI